MLALPSVPLSAFDRHPDAVLALRAVRGPSGAPIDFVVTYANESALAAFGRTASLGTGVHAALGAESALFRGCTVALEAPASGPDDAPASDADPSPELVALAIDTDTVVTFHRNTPRRPRRESAHREAWLEAIVEGAPMGIAVFDRDLRFVRVNACLAKLHGLPADAHVGRTFGELLPATAQSVEHEYRVVLETGIPTVGRNVEVHAFGQAWHFDVSIYPVVVRGVVEGVVGIVQDITSRKRDEAARDLLARASRVLAAPLDVRDTAAAIAALFVPTYADWSAVFVRDDDREDAEVTEIHVEAHAPSLHARELRALFAGAPSDVRERCFGSDATGSREPRLVPLDTPGEPPRFRGDAPGESAHAGGGDAEVAFRAQLRALGTRSMVVVPMVHHGRHVGTIALGHGPSGRVFLDAEQPIFAEVAGRAAAAIENARLFALAKAERKRADDANRAKDDFLAVVSHELRTPLNAVLGWAHLLLGESLDAAHARKALQTIERNAKAQAQLIEDLLDYSRIISGKLRLDVEPCDLSRVVDAAIEVIAPAAEAKRIRVNTSLEATVGAVVGDPHRLQQAVWNLLTNAVKFTPPNGSVHVRVLRDDRHVVVEVEDTGVGIAEEFLPQVFERFQQADMGSRRKHGGLGLGLAIARHVVELHGGSIEAESAGLGQGATFRVRIPIADQVRRPEATAVRASSPPQSLAESAAGTRVRGLAILVVDDEPDARELLASLLTACGAVVTRAASAKEARARLEESRFDILVSDIGMPDEDGYDLIERVRALPEESGGRIPAVALTAFARAADRAKALLAGYDAHVTKPVDATELLAVLANVRQRLAR